MFQFLSKTISVKPERRGVYMTICQAKLTDQIPYRIPLGRVPDKKG